MLTIAVALMIIAILVVSRDRLEEYWVLRQVRAYDHAYELTKLCIARGDHRIARSHREQLARIEGRLPRWIARELQARTLDLLAY